MVISAAFLLTFLATLLGLLLTNLATKRFSSLGILDIPEKRSLHSRSTPTAGGLVFLFIFCLLISFNYFDEVLTFDWLILIIGMSLLGGVDDLMPQKVRVRLVAQTILSLICWSSVFINPLPEGHPFFDDYYLAITLLLCTFFSLLHINFFNFMDGSDGFAATQGIIFFIFHAIVFYFYGEEHLFIYCLSIAGILVGFLAHNWPPAKIFMGDTGSYFIATQMLFIGFYGYQVSGFLFSLIILAPFTSDSVFTLCKRIIAKKKWWRPHKEHIYQRLILLGLQPALLNIYLIMIHLFIFIPLSLVVIFFENLRMLVFLISFGACAVIWYYLNIKITDRTVHNNV